MSWWNDPARGPFVIVNVYARARWEETYTTYREARAARKHALTNGDLRMITIDSEEAKIMPLAQFLVEYGQ